MLKNVFEIAMILGIMVLQRRGNVGLGQNRIGFRETRFQGGLGHSSLIAWGISFLIATGIRC